MSNLDPIGVKLDGRPRDALDLKVSQTRSQLADVARTLKEILGDQAESVPDITTVTYGVKVLVVHTADGGCYVYDGVHGVCRACDASEQ